MTYTQVSVPSTIDTLPVLMMVMCPLSLLGSEIVLAVDSQSVLMMLTQVLLAIDRLEQSGTCNV